MKSNDELIREIASVGCTLLDHIYNNALDYFTNTDDCIMWDYLREQIRNGNITQDEAEEIADDVITAYQESED